MIGALIDNDSVSLQFTPIVGSWWLQYIRSIILKNTKILVLKYLLNLKIHFNLTFEAFLVIPGIHNLAFR